MRHLAISSALIAVMLAMPAAAEKRDGWYRQGDFSPVKRIAIRISNPGDDDRIEAPVTLTPEQLPEIRGAQPFTVTLVDPALPPQSALTPRQRAIAGPHGLREEEGGHAIFYQLDDLDKDGLWDELFFMTDIAAHETKTLYLYLGFQQRGWNPHRTNAAIGSYMRHVVPFWESENVGWKLWFPTDIDIYAKREPVLMSNRLLTENLDGYAVSYADPAYGSDIMSVDSSFGGGGIGLFETPGSDALSRPRFTPHSDLEHRFNGNGLKDTRYAFDVVVNGPLRSIVRIKTMNWNTGHGHYDLTQTYTAYAGKNYSTAKVHFDRFEPENPGAALAVGIRKRPGSTMNFREDGVVVTAGPEVIRNPDDTESDQNALKVAYAGTALVVSSAYTPDYVYDPDQGENHVFRLRPGPDGDYEYLIAAGWSEGATLKTADAFKQYVLDVARERDNPVRLIDAHTETRPAD